MRVLARITTVALASLASLGIAVVATGATHPVMEKDWQEVAEKADEVGYIIARPDPSTVREDGSVFYPTGPISDETLVVIADEDGALPAGLELADVQRHVSAVREGKVDSTVVPAANGWRLYSAVLNSWSGEYSGTNIIGGMQTRVSYGFTVQPGTVQQVTGQGLTYYRGYNGSTFGTWAQWVGLGISKDGYTSWGGGPWTNVAATAKFKAKSIWTAYATGEFYSGGYTQ